MAGEWMERMLGEQSDELMKARANATPPRRVVTAGDVAETAMSLIESNKSVTGVIPVVDGGFSSVT
jgi:3-oxoacyl-[acyl-carrier protein] reductase